MMGQGFVLDRPAPVGSCAEHAYSPIAVIVDTPHSKDKVDPLLAVLLLSFAIRRSAGLMARAETCAIVAVEIS